jgi:hypothetical protein
MSWERCERRSIFVGIEFGTVPHIVTEIGSVGVSKSRSS